MAGVTSLNTDKSSNVYLYCSCGRVAGDSDQNLQNIKNDSGRRSHDLQNITEPRKTLHLQKALRATQEFHTQKILPSTWYKHFCFVLNFKSNNKNFVETLTR